MCMTCQKRKDELWMHSLIHRVSARTPIAPGEYICCWNSAVTIQLFLV